MTDISKLADEALVVKAAEILHELILRYRESIKDNSSAFISDDDATDLWDALVTLEKLERELKDDGS